MKEGDAQFLKEFDILRFRHSEWHTADDVIAREEPLEVRLNGRSLAFLMRLPGDDILLAVGYCLSEGLITDRSQIDLVRHCTDPEGQPGGASQAGPGNLVEVMAGSAAGVERFGEARIIRTGCGGADLDSEVDLESIAVETETRFDAAVLAGVPDRLLEEQEVFKVSGGTHGAGLFDTSGGMLVVKEDVGRHNAVDKVLGFMLMAGESPSDKGLMLSGRLSYEMVLKAARAGLPLVCSISAPTALGVEVGKKTGVTLVGFLRDGNFNVYSHTERIGPA